MAYTLADLYAEVADHLKEDGSVVAGSEHDVAKKIARALVGSAEAVLARHPYNFASATRPLALDATADPADPDSDPIGWRYAYKKGQILRVNWISPTGKERDRYRRAGQWEDKGGRILANDSPLYIDAVLAVFATEAKMGYWPRLFGRAVASVVADQLAGPVTNSRGSQADISIRSRAFCEEAEVWDANQSPPPSQRGGSWNQARRRGRARFGTGEL